MTNIRIDIASEFKDKGFKAAEKRTRSLTRRFDDLSRTARRTFIAIAGVQAIRKSVNAFIEEDRAVTKLTQSLNNLGLGYNVGAIERFISATQAATGVNDSQLRPAMVQLTTTTLDAQKAMQLLTVAMDISAATGASLDSTTTALSRAYNGNYATLGKLQTAYTTAELKAMGFEASVAALTSAFGGTAAANADSYGGKVDRLKIAFDEASESIGKGFIDALTLIGEGNFDKVLMSIAEGANAVGNFFVKTTAAVKLFGEMMRSTLDARISPAEQARIDALQQIMANPNAPKPGTNTAAANRQFLADYKKQVALQKKVEADRKKAAALAAKADAERLKREKEAQMLKRAGSVFDMENIQIVAAMQGRISDEQRLRLIGLLAINNDMADAADKTTRAILAFQAPALQGLGITIATSDNATTIIEKLIKAQTQLVLVNGGITSLPKAKNPFEDWDAVMKNIISNLDTIATKIKNMPSASSTTTATSTTSISTPSGTTTTTSIAAPTGLGAVARGEYPRVAEIAAAVLASNYAPEQVTAALGMGAVSRGEYSAYIPTPYSAGMGGFGRGEYGAPTVVVNVAGNVTTESDLVEAIRDSLYGFQKSGGLINIESVAI